MDEAEKYQERLQAIAEKRRMQEAEEKVRRETEEEWLKLAQHKRKSLREQWLMEASPSSAEDPKTQSVIPAPQTTEQSAEETQSSERLMKQEVEKTENMKEESSQIRENEPSIQTLSADNTEKPTQIYLGEERNVLEVMEVKVERNLLSKSPQNDTEEKKKAEDQEVTQLTVDAVEPVDLPHHSLEQNRSPDEADFSLAERTTELIMAEGDADVEEEDWEMVNCNQEEGLHLVLTSDLTQGQTVSGLSHGFDGAVLKVKQVFIMDGEEDLEIGAPEVLSLVVAAKKSDLEGVSCESWPERNREERPPEGALPTLCLEKGAHASTSALSSGTIHVPDTISEEPPVYLVNCEQNLPHSPAHTTQALEDILGDNTVYKGDQSISSGMIVNVEWEEASGPENEVSQYIALDRKREKSPPLLQREVVAQNTEQESEIQIMMPPSVTQNRAETGTSKRKTCHCCTIM